MFNFTSALTFVDNIVTNGLFLAQGSAPSCRPPELLQGYSAELLQDDLNYLIARWFIDSLRSNHIPADKPYPYIRETVENLLKKRFCNTISTTELQRISTELSRIIHQVEVSKKVKRKSNFSVDERYKLLSSSEGKCQICGFIFPDEVKEKFIKRSASIQLPKYDFYDFLKPTRRSSWDFQIEIDHIRPIARGGTNDMENLQLLCGYCNSTKKHFTTIFDPSERGSEINHPVLGKLRLTSSFLVVRVLVGNSCYSCGRKSTDTELTVTPLYFHERDVQETEPVETPAEFLGEINPVNRHSAGSRELIEEVVATAGKAHQANDLASLI